jgi:hypothetical protein
MQCPHCGNELSGALHCSKCGRKAAHPKRDIEVEYKEFKVSEFLEIRKPQQESKEEETGNTGQGSSFSPEHPAAVEGKSPGTGAKRFRIALLLVLILGGIITGAYFLLNLLSQR